MVAWSVTATPSASVPVSVSVTPVMPGSPPSWMPLPLSVVPDEVADRDRLHLAEIVVNEVLGAGDGDRRDRVAGGGAIGGNARSIFPLGVARWLRFGDLVGTGRRIGEAVGALALVVVVFEKPTGLPSASVPVSVMATLPIGESPVNSVPLKSLSR